MKKWYVHDVADCWDSFETVEAAGQLAKNLDEQGEDGVHVVCMTETQHAVYTQSGDLREAYRVK